MKSEDELTALFRRHGLKVTPQRQCIFRLLQGEENHPTADAVYQRARGEMPTISLRTVYQVLNELADLGEVQLLDLGTGAGRFDPNVEPHHHLVCEACGKVRDLHVDYSGLRVPPRQRQGFTIDAAEVVFRGVCDECSPQREDVHA